MTVNACCYLCRKQGNGYLQSLIKKGWTFFEGSIDFIRYKFELCEKHTPRYPEVMDKIREGRRIYRSSVGIYTPAPKSRF
ncbi:MAG: hypothetical protein WC759_00055 [Candidatus Micrarchaeia archaeon]|jgi:hypothetical protein